MDFLKGFDFFPKLNDGVDVKQTEKGGMIFSFFAALMAALCLFEVYDVFLGDPSVLPYVSPTDLEDRTRVNFNISVYEVPCEALSMDFQDITGSHFEDLEQTIKKLKLNQHGYVIDHEEYELVKKFEKKNFHPSVPFINHFISEETSCYGAELYQGQKCRTCQDVQSAYIQRGWPVPAAESIKQCQMGRRLAQSVDNETIIEPMIEEVVPSTILNNNNDKVNRTLILDPHFESTKFEFENIAQNGLYNLKVYRKQCFEAKQVSFDISYLNENGIDMETQKLENMTFPAHQCLMHIPFRVVSIDEENHVVELENLLLQKNIPTIKIKVQGNKLFDIKINGVQEGNNNKASIYSKLTSKQSMNIHPRSRILHAEFYGYDDTQPVIISIQVIEYFRKMQPQGCQLVGTMLLKQVPGNFHISTHHKGLALNYIERQITARHTVHFLEFTREQAEVVEGKLGKSFQTNYLDGTEIKPILDEQTEYYIKIVGSKMDHFWQGAREFYQYVGHVNTPDSMSNLKNQVTIMFKYEFDPISMDYHDRNKGFVNFLVSLLAIIGGIFATSVLVDKVINK